MITTDIQTLEPGELVTLYELDASTIGAVTLRFHGYTDSGSVIWQGNTYEPWAIQAEGFERTGSGQQPTPTLSVGNIGMVEGAPVSGIISSMCLQYDDLVGAQLIRHRTMVKYLDGQPEADPTQEFPPEIWIVEQKTAENSEAVEFTLSSAIDFEGKQLPGRQIIASVCPWLWIGGYRGPYCGYTGNDYFDKRDNPVSDPTLDQCGGRVTSCRKRFKTDPMNFGGFEAADRLA